MIVVPLAIGRDGTTWVALTEVVVTETVEEVKAAAEDNQSQETQNNYVGDDSIFLIRATHLFLRIDFIETTPVLATINKNSL